MSISINSMVFLLLIAVIPALIVAVVTMLRIETIRGDAKAASKSMEQMIESYSRIVSQFGEINDRLSTQSAGLHETGLRIVNLDESIKSINNKLSSRDRADRESLKRKEKEEGDVEIPGTKQTILDFAKIPGAIPLTQRQEPVKKEREIGEYPEEWFGNGMA